MKRVIVLLAAFFFVLSARAQELALTGNLHVAPEYWSKMGMDDDTKLGFGLGLMAGLALDFDGTRFSLGPHVGANRWSADYSSKDQSATQSVYAELMDLGIQFALADLDSTEEGMILWGGMGEGTLGMGMVLEGGETYAYPDINGSTYTYYEIGIGWRFGLLFLRPRMSHTKGDQNSIGWNCVLGSCSSRSASRSGGSLSCTRASLFLRILSHS